MKIKVADIANLINIRTFLFQAINNLAVNIRKEDVRALQAKVSQIDKLIISSSLELDLNQYNEQLASAGLAQKNKTNKDLKQEVVSQEETI